MAETDIELTVGLTVEDIGRSAKTLQDRIHDIFDKTSGQQLDMKLQRLKQQMASVTSETMKVVSEMSKLEETSLPTEQYKATEQHLKSIKESYANMQKVQENLRNAGVTSGDTWDSIQKQLEHLGDIIEEDENKLQELVDTGEAFTLGSETEEYQRLADKLALLNNRQRMLLMQWDESGGKAANGFKKFQSVLNGVSKVMNTIGRASKIVFNNMLGFLRQGVSVAKRFVSSIASIPSHFKRASKASSNFNMTLKKGISSILKYGLGFASLAALINKVRAAAKDGINAVVQWEGANGQLNKSISSMLSALNTLKNSIGAAFVPLLNSIAPIITNLINLLNAAVQKIAMFIAAITGKKTFLSANKVQTDYAKSLDKTAGSAGKAKKAMDGYLASFDELNNINSNDSAGFTETPIDPGMLDLIDKLKKMWEMGDFTELGKMLGEQLRDFLESIPWKQIQDTAEKLGKSLATLINGFVEVEGLGYDIGKTIAESLNTIFHFVNGFVHALHWDSIGKFIGETFNGFFENIDWPLIYDTVVTGMAGIAEALQSFIDTFHWDNLSTFIINGVNTIVSGILAFVDGVDWGDLGAKIGEQMRKTISGIPWRKVGEAIGALLQAAIDFAENLVDQLNADQIRQAIKDLIEGFFDRVDSEQLGRTVAKYLNLIIDIIKGFWEDNGDTIKEEGKKLFKGFFDEVDKEDLKDTVFGILKAAFIVGITKAIPQLLSFVKGLGLGGKIIEALMGGAGGLSGAVLPIAGIVATIAALGYSIIQSYGGVGEAIKKVKSVASNVFESLKTYAEKLGLAEKLQKLKEKLGELFQSLGGLKSLWDVVFALLQRIVTYIGGTVMAVINAIIPVITGVVGVITGIIQVLGGLFDILVGFFTGNKDLVVQGANKLWEGIKDAFHGGIDLVVGLLKGFVDLILAPFRTIKYMLVGDPIVIDMWNEIKRIFEDSIGKVIDFVKNLKEKVIELFQKLKENIDEKIKAIKDKFKEFAEDIKQKKEDIANKLAELKNKFAEKFDEIKSKIQEKVQDVKSKLTELVSKFTEIKNNISEALSNIASKIGEKLNEAKGKIDTFKSNVSSTLSQIKDTFVSAFENIKEGIKTPINGIIGFVEKFVNGVIKAINKLGDRLGDFEFDIPDALAEKFDLPTNFKIDVPRLSEISIPRLAKGAVIPPNKEFLAMLGDQSHGTNIEAPLDTLVDAFTTANKGGNEQELSLLQEQNELLKKLLDKEFGITERQIYNSVINQDNMRRKATGSSAFAY